MGAGTNIKKILNENKIKQKIFAKMIDEDEVNVSRWLNETRGIPESVYSKISLALNITVDEIINEKKIGIKVVPLIGRSSCGIPKEYDLNGYEPIPIPEKMYRDGMYAVEADGESMYPKINHGDIVFCNPTQIIDNGKIVHYCLNGESGIKKYKINESGTIISLIPLNPNFEIITIHCDDLVDLKMAKVVGKIDNDF